MTAQQTIDRIDAEIDANRRGVFNRIHAMPDTARAWQNVWDRYPDLHQRECGLFRQRGNAQILRDDETNKAWATEQRKARALRRKAA